MGTDDKDKTPGVSTLGFFYLKILKRENMSHFGYRVLTILTSTTMAVVGNL
jgi:hypothetical protein